MKSFLKIAVGVLALSFAQQASAVTTVRLTGSTAFRAAAHRAIISMLGGDGSTFIAYAGTGPASQAKVEGSNFVTYTGTMNSTSYVIQVSFSGSVEGIAALTGDATYATMPFILASAVSSTAGVANAAIIPVDAAGSPSASTETGTAKHSLSDCFQSTTAYTGGTALNPAVQVAVAPFAWVANRGTTGITNMTAQLATQLLASGFIQKSMFTGLASDDPTPAANPTSGSYVFATGRNPLSGTRITTLAETKYGVFTPVQQYVGLTSGTAGSGSITQLNLWPTAAGVNANATSTTVDPTAGNGGYSSGGNMATLLGMAGTSVLIKDDTGGTLFPSALPVTVIGYLGASDANTAVGNGATRLNYEGSTYTTVTFPEVINGQYTFWCYENLYTVAGFDTFFRDQLVAKLAISSILGNTAVLLSDMKVNRQTDGALVGH